ncbi:MAG: hypothetical protein PHQ28_12545 [Mycobacterium sp.]|nr:hypothetical protein [Mycobacterium sp.]
MTEVTGSGVANSHTVEGYRIRLFRRMDGRNAFEVNGKTTPQRQEHVAAQPYGDRRRGGAVALSLVLTSNPGSGRAERHR